MEENQRDGWGSKTPTVEGNRRDTKITPFFKAPRVPPLRSIQNNHLVDLANQPRRDTLENSPRIYNSDIEARPASYRYSMGTDRQPKFNEDSNIDILIDGRDTNR